MGKLVLDSLEIKNFRTFKHLTIARLGRVNLIVGRNNVGKTSLLEALWTYAIPALPLGMWNLMSARNETKFQNGNISIGPEDWISGLKNLFYGRKYTDDGSQVIEIGPKDDAERQLSISVGLYTLGYDDKGIQVLTDVQTQASNNGNGSIPRLKIKMGNQVAQDYGFDDNSYFKWSQNLSSKGVRVIYITSNGLHNTEITPYWDNITLTPLEDAILKAMRIIEPETEGINLRDFKGERIPIIKTKGLEAPIPLRSLGDGMSHLFGLALALVNAKDGILLVDEIDNGLHYSVLTDVWKLIFETAHRLNVQVFATTHSWECIEAFQKATEENKQEEGLLIRLQNKKGEVVPTIFDERSLAIITREQIEVR